MKKIVFAVLMFIILASATSSSLAQRAAKEDKVYTPDTSSVEYKAIYAAVQRQHPKINKIPAVMRVQGQWARFAYLMEEIPEEEEPLQSMPDATHSGVTDEDEIRSIRGKVTGPNVILKKTGGEWEIAYEFTPSDDKTLLEKVKDVPRAIKVLRAAKQKVAAPRNE